MKITLIGAGSVVFAKTLLGDILQFPELSDATICLMDIDSKRLEVAELMTRQMIAVLQVKAKLEATGDRRKAIQGANYVICTVQVGGYRPGTVIDFEIPRKYGLLQTIGDTLGVGGVFRGLRTIPVLVDIARDIAEVGAPNCLLLNYSNPMAMLCQAVAQATGIPHVWLCHSVQGTSHQLATYAGLPMEDVTYLVAGINHMAFFLEFKYKGQDAYPLLFELLHRADFKQDLVRMEMMRRTGYFVTESSEHQSEYVPYFIHHGKEMQERFEVPIDEYLRRCESAIASWQKTERELLGGRDRPMVVAGPSNEYGSFIIHSRETNTPRVIYGNVPNAGLIENLPREACVEVPCLVDAQGIQPTHIGRLPPQLAALCQTNINVQALTVEAALTGRREHIYHAVMLDPHTSTVLPLDKIWAMCDELIAAHQKVGLLGEFAATLPGTGRAYAGTGDRIVAQVEPCPGQRTQAELRVTNPSPRSVTADFDVTCVPLAANAGHGRPHENGSSRVRLKVPAGQSAAKQIGVTPPGDKGSFVIQLTSSSPNILTRDGVVRERRSLAAQDEEGAPLQLTVAGFAAARGTLQVTRSEMILRLTVDDSKIVSRAQPWTGSSIELFFADLQCQTVHQFFLAPRPGARKVAFLNKALQPVKKAKATIEPRAGGYAVELHLPLAATGLARPATSFLFDLIINISALGDAHSGGKTSLSGDMDSHVNSRNFHQVDLA